MRRKKNWTAIYVCTYYILDEIIVQGAWSRGMIFASHVKGRGFNSHSVQIFCHFLPYVLSYEDVQLNILPLYNECIYESINYRFIDSRNRIME